MLELKDLRLVVEVAKAAGFRRAAAHLRIRQSVVSRRVRDLEDEIGVSLFERHRGGVRLTNAGSRLIDDIRPLLGRLDAIISAVKANGYAGEGRLVLGLANSLSSGLIRQILEDWMLRHPKVETTIREGGPQKLISGILNRDIDVTFLTGATWPPGCDAERLWNDHVFAVVPADSKFALRPTLSVDDLADEKFIVCESGFGPEIRDWVIKRLSDLGVSPRIELLDVGLGMLMTLVGLRLGVGLVSGCDIGVIYPNVAYVEVSAEELPYSVVWSPENDNPALRRFLSTARIIASQHPGAAASKTRDRSP